MRLDEAPVVAWRDALEMLTSDFIGEGISRTVYGYRPDERYIIKAEVGVLGKFQNQREWLVWQAVKDMPQLSRWFAACLFISPAGMWLVQERTHPVTLFECRKAFKKIPEIYTDLKADNFGRLPDGRIVCHDYGYALTAENGLSNRMKKADWRS